MQPIRRLSESLGPGLGGGPTTILGSARRDALLARVSIQRDANRRTRGGRGDGRDFSFLRYFFSCFSRFFISLRECGVGWSLLWKISNFYRYARSEASPYYKKEVSASAAESEINPCLNASEYCRASQTAIYEFTGLIRVTWLEKIPKLCPSQHL